MILTLDPVLSSRRKVPNWTYLVAISTGMLSTRPSVHLNFSSSGRVGLVPGGVVLTSGDNRDTVLAFNEVCNNVTIYTGS